MDLKVIPTLPQLVSAGYLKTGETDCPNGDVISIAVDGVVTSAKP
ncbi:hypothetical protein [Planococcus sp. ANT_H30]|nr:hypothetical protein [Planococcus sp. ANT_H30]